MNVTGIILAGGKSLRFGRNKAVEVIGGETLVARVIKNLSPVTNRIVVVTNGDNNSFSNIKSIEVAADIYPAKGPLGGIYTGLSASKTVTNIVVACDMPFLNTTLLKYMIGLLPGFDAVIPRWTNNQIEPLHGIYSTNCMRVMKDHLENNRLSISDYLNQIRVLYFEEKEFKKFDPEFLSFFNVNNQADIDRLNQIESGKRIK
jgi:molybdenum cofactor guanylyltransferase